MNWSKDRSIALSRGCVVLFMILLAALDIGCYWAVRWFIGLRFMPWQSGVLMMVTIYLCSGFGWVLLVRLWQLLDNIRLQLVFDLRNVKLLRQVRRELCASSAACIICRSSRSPSRRASWRCSCASSRIFSSRPST